MLTGAALLLTLLSLATGQVPGVVPEQPEAAPQLEIILPGQATPETSVVGPPETHAPEEPQQPDPRLWVKAEYLLWYNKAGQFPALLTTGSNTDRIPGALGNPSTKIVFGGNVEYHDLSGGRFAFGYFLDEASHIGLEAGYLFLGRRATEETSTSPGNPVLARPFFDVIANMQNASLSAFPGLISGSVTVKTTTFMEGADSYLSLNLWNTPHFRLEALGGFRYWHLSEDLNVAENTKVDPSAPVFAGNNILVSDFFGTENYFYGGQLGLRGLWQWKRLTLEFNTKIAMGCSQEIMTIRGATSINTTPASNFNSGFLALASNSGRLTRDDFVAIPEVGVNLGVRLTDRIQLFAGYSFLYWANVLRPGDQIDTNINPNLIPTSNTFGVPGGPNHPTATFHESSYWAQGLNLGLEIRY